MCLMFVYVCMCMYVYVCVCVCMFMCIYIYMYVYVCIYIYIYIYICNELGGNMARSTQFPIMITRSTIIYEIVSPGAAGSSIYI